MSRTPTTNDNILYNDINSFIQMREDVAVIKQHILVLNSEGGETRDELKKVNCSLNTIQVDIAAGKSKQELMDKFMWILISVSAGALLSSILNLVLKR